MVSLSKALEIIPRRWVIERTFGWLGRTRRLAKDVERLIETSTTMVVVAIIQLLITRLASDGYSIKTLRTGAQRCL